MLPTIQQDVSLGCAELETFAPGLYVDQMGGQYFYLTGIVAGIAKRLWDNPRLRSPAFIADVLEELRRELIDRSCTELMD